MTRRTLPKIRRFPSPSEFLALLGLLALPAAGLGLSAGTARAGADRVLQIVAAPDEEFQSRPGWEETLRVTVQQVSDRMEGEFGLRLRIVRIAPWTSTAPDYDLSALRAEVKRRVLPGADEDLVVGFCGRVTPEHERRLMRLGQSDTPGRTIAVSDVAGRELALVLRHELAHSFGVPHISNVPSVMNPDLRSDRDDFDSASAAILRNNLQMDFAAREPFANVRLEILESLYEDLARHDNYVADLLSTVGESYHARGRTDEALALFRRALELDPELVSPHLGRGRVALEQERYADAVQEFEAARAREPRLARLDMNLALAYAGLGQKSNAMFAYERAIKADPRDVAALNNLGLLCLENDEADRAELLFRRTLTIQPRYAEAWNNLGMLYARTERNEQAMEALSEALSIDETPIAHKNMAYVLLALGRRDEARQHLEAARQLTSEAADSAR